MGIIAIVLGVIGIEILGFPIPAIILGHISLRKHRKNTVGIIGLILGYIGLIISTTMWAIVLVYGTGW